jgi:hypothetical protein
MQIEGLATVWREAQRRRGVLIASYLRALFAAADSGIKEASPQPVQDRQQSPFGERAIQKAAA